jgi:lipoprotein-anchoring transpeptidase ErfK/SrfK
MPFPPLRLAPLVLAATVALSGTATASVLVTVNKATQRMTVLVDGETRYSWPVSTGMKGYATPAGTFRPFRLEEEHYSKEWDDAPMPHSIFFTPAGHAIHGSNATRRLGSPASHGCIRVSPANAAKLFALVSAEGLSNTKVVVTGGQVTRVAKRQTPQARPPRLRPERDYGEAAYGGPYYRYPARPVSAWSW